MIFVTGDIHGNINRLSELCFPEQKEMTKDDCVIILGDFGVIWNWRGENQEENAILDILEKKPFTTLFIDGNHECFDRLYQYPVKEWNGGKVHELRPSVLHLMRGEIFNIQNKKFFAFGGASSHDIKDGIFDPKDYKNEKEFKAFLSEFDRKNPMALYRIKNRSWWERELPTEEEMENGIKNLTKYNKCVDFVLTHTPPASVISLLGHGLYKQDILTKYLEDIRSSLSYCRWFSGHMHINKQMNLKDIILYEQIIRIL